MRTARSGCLIALCLGGCTRYQAQPLEEQRILDELRSVTLASGMASATARGTATAFDPADGLSETEASSLALALNPDLRARRAEKGLGEAQLLAAGLYPDPEIDATWIARSDGPLLEGSLLQALPLAGERGIRREKARLRLEETDLEIAWDEWKLVQEVRLAFTDAVASEALVSAQRRGLELRQKVLDVMQARQDLGAASLMELDLPVLDVARQRQQVLSAESQGDLARQHLNRLLGLGPRVSYDLQDGGLDGEERPLPSNLERMEEVAIAKRPDLAATRLAYEQAERDLQLAARGQYPRLRIGPSYNKEESNDGLGIGAGVEIPLWNRNRGEIAEKLAQRAKLGEVFRARIAALRAELAGALAQAERLARQLKDYREEVRPRLERSVSLVEETLKAGKADPVALLLIQDRLLEARREDLVLRADCRRALIRLEEALGTDLDVLNKP